MKTVFILIDALRTDYVSESTMPFLYQLAMNNIYVKRIVPSFGFCERTEIFTGMRPNVSGNFTALGYDKELSEYQNFHHFLKKINIIDRKIDSLTFRKILKKVFKRLGIKMPPYQIPLELLSSLYLTEDRISQYEPHAFNGESLFDLLREKCCTVDINTFTELGSKCKLTDIERFDYIAKHLHDDYDFLVSYIGMIDWFGHTKTHDKEFMSEKLHDVDQQLKKIYGLLKLTEEHVNFVILGDHGMIPVRKKIDFMSKFFNTGLNLHTDVDVFIDSTIIRVWIYNEIAFERINKLFELEYFKDNGFLLTDCLADQYNIPFHKKNANGDNIYGDFIWAARPGVIISPDYFNKGKNLTGMHGYADIVEEGKGVLVISTAEKYQLYKESANLIDVCPTLCDLLEIPIPNKCQGTSIFKRRQ